MLALSSQVARRKVLVLRDQQDFIERGPDFWLDFGETPTSDSIPATHLQ